MAVNKLQMLQLQMSSMKKNGTVNIKKHRNTGRKKFPKE